MKGFNYADEISFNIVLPLNEITKLYWILWKKLNILVICIWIFICQQLLDDTNSFANKCFRDNLVNFYYFNAFHFRSNWWIPKLLKINYIPIRALMRNPQEQVTSAKLDSALRMGVIRDQLLAEWPLGAIQCFVFGYSRGKGMNRMPSAFNSPTKGWDSTRYVLFTNNARSVTEQSKLFEFI